MSYITIKTEKNETYSSISNFFIDYYMTSANGEFVKVYLYLVRLLSSRQPVSVADIADHFNLTEKDICRAVRYWIEQGVLRLECDENGEPTGITLLPLEDKKETFSPTEADSLSLLGRDYSDRRKSSDKSDDKHKVKSAKKSSGKSSKADKPSKSNVTTIVRISAPDKAVITPELLNKKKDDDILSDIIFETETYFGRPLSLAEMQSLIYIYDQLGFSQELVEYLIEYCLTNDHPSLRYAEAVAKGWYEGGIDTVDKAKAEGRAFNPLYRKVFEELGIRRIQPTGIEAAYIDSWLSDMNFSEELILLACRKAIITKPQSVNFAYVNGILENWHRNGVQSITDVEKLDQEFIKRKSGAASRGSNTASRNPNGFAEFAQTDMSDQLGQLEHMLADELNSKREA